MIADVRFEWSDKAELADRDAARAVAHADALHSMLEIAWTVEPTGATLTLDELQRRLTGVDRARLRAAAEIADQNRPDPDN